MRVIEVRYEELKNTGNYNNERIGVTVEVNEGESANEAIDRARKFVKNKQRYYSGTDGSQRASYLERIENPDEYTGAQVKAAQQWLEENPIDTAFDF